MTEQVATELEATDITALYIESVNEIITLHAQRITAGIYARVPDTVIVFLLILAIGSTAMVGFGAGRAGRRNLVTAILMIVALGATFTPGR